jgi:CheY-like chemotaxis protein
MAMIKMTRRLDFLPELLVSVVENFRNAGASTAHAGAGHRYIVARKDSKPLLILHVEDDENDAILFRKACERAGLPARIQRVESVEEATSYLTGDGPYADRAEYPLPQIVILDLKMPRVDGFEFLKWLRHTEVFALLPVLVFTASISREDKCRAMAEGANSYFIKPASFEALVKMVAGFGVPNEGQWN